jgi:hypothetical protein
MALVSVMLVSAYQRLLLYESAYGFTSFRTYAHTFMVWLGLLLLAVVVLELLGRRRAFALALLGAAVGFAGSLALLNVDSFIVNANLERARLGYSLDVSYLGSLSLDAVPSLVRQYEQAQTDGDEDLATQVAGALACHAVQNDDYELLPDWQSWHRSRAQAYSQWQALQANDEFQDIQVFPPEEWPDDLIIRMGGEEFNCWETSSRD